MYRQGDVLIVRAGSIPPSAKRLVSNIVERGELTGHAHRMVGDATLLDDRETMYIQVRSESQLVHEEHGTITIPEGNYRVIRQREYDGKEIRYVRD